MLLSLSLNLFCLLPIDSRFSLQTFNKESDKNWIIKLFNANYEHLVDQSAKDFSIEWTLDNLRLFPEYKEKLIIKTATIKTIPAGFIAYSIDNKNRGNIDMLCIDSQWRRNGCGFKLLNYAVEDLKQKGISKIKLGVTNIAAQKLYEKYGFKKKKKWPYGDSIIMVLSL